MSFLAVMALLGGAAYLGRDATATAVARAQDDLFGAEVHAQRIVSSDPAPDRGPELAIDGAAYRSWAAKTPGNTSTDFLEATFEKPLRLSYVFISGGASSDPELFRKERRPTRAEIITKGQDREPISVATVDLQDIIASQHFYIGADNVSTVTLRILASTGPEDAAVSVAELQFFGRL